MVFRVVILETAGREYRDIVDYLARVLLSPQAARSFALSFREQVRLVSRAPEARPLSALPEVAALGYRPCPVKGYLFLYRVRGDRVEIAHVFHQSQDYARRL